MAPRDAFGAPCSAYMRFSEAVIPGSPPVNALISACQRSARACTLGSAGSVSVIGVPLTRYKVLAFGISESDRRYDESTHEWSVDRRHWSALNAIFSNFADWDLDNLNSR